MKYSFQDPLWCKFCPTNRQEYVISEKDSLDYSLDIETSEVAVNSTQANETDLETSKSSTEGGMDVTVKTTKISIKSEGKDLSNEVEESKKSNETDLLTSEEISLKSEQEEQSNRTEE